MTEEAVQESRETAGSSRYRDFAARPTAEFYALIGSNVAVAFLIGYLGFTFNSVREGRGNAFIAIAIMIGLAACLLIALAPRGSYRLSRQELLFERGTSSTRVAWQEVELVTRTSRPSGWFRHACIRSPQATIHLHSATLPDYDELLKVADAALKQARASRYKL